MMATETFELERATNSLILRRDVNAAPERLFAAWTKPEQVTKWWDPSGSDLATCTIDLREGGTFRFTNLGHEEHPFEGRYTQIDPPNRIAFDAMGAKGLVTLESRGDATRMVVTMTCASPEQLEQFVKMGIGDGTARSLENLAGFVAD